MLQFDAHAFVLETQGKYANHYILKHTQSGFDTIQNYMYIVGHFENCSVYSVSVKNTCRKILLRQYTSRPRQHESDKMQQPGKLSAQRIE